MNASTTRIARVLVVEDEPIIGLLLTDLLETMGMTPVGPAGSLSEAMDAIADGAFDAAVVDINLRGEMSFPAGEALARAGVPFFFVTGFAREAIPPALANVPVVQKPYTANCIAGALARVAGGKA